MRLDGRRTGALLASAALHAGLLGLLFGLEPASRPAPRAPGPVWLSLEHAAPAPAAVVAPPVRRVARAPAAPRPAGAPAAAPEGGSPGSSEVPAGGGSGLPGPRATPGLVLFPSQILDGVAGGGSADGLPGGAGEAVRRMLTAVALVQRTSPSHAFPPTLEIGRRFETWFMPLTVDLEHAATLGLGLASHVSSFLDDYGRAVDAFTHGCRTDGSAPLVTSSLCSTGQGHQALALESIVQVEHSDDGMPSSWRLVQSSGSASFDASALDAVASAVRLEQQQVFTSPPRPRWSRWAFTARAYRYHRLELLLDPGFDPLGRRVEEDSSVLGVTSVTREVRLVGLEYRT